MGIVGFNRSPRASKPAREIKLVFEKEKVKTQRKDKIGWEKSCRRNEEMEVSLKKASMRDSFLTQQLITSVLKIRFLPVVRHSEHKSDF